VEAVRIGVPAPEAGRFGVERLLNALGAGHVGSRSLLAWTMAGEVPIVCAANGSWDGPCTASGKGKLVPCGIRCRRIGRSAGDPYCLHPLWVTRGSLCGLPTSAAPALRAELQLRLVAIPRDQMDESTHSHQPCSGRLGPTPSAALRCAPGCHRWRGSCQQGCRGRSAAGDVDVDAEISGDACERLAHVALGPEPELMPERAPRSEGLGDEEPTGAVAGGDGGGLVQQRSGIQDLEDLGVWVANDAEITAGQGGEELGELPAAGCVDALQESPVPEGGKRKVGRRPAVHRASRRRGPARRGTRRSPA